MSELSQWNIAPNGWFHIYEDHPVLEGCKTNVYFSPDYWIQNYLSTLWQ